MGTLMENQRAALDAATKAQKQALAEAVRDIRTDHARAMQDVNEKLEHQEREIQGLRRDRDAFLPHLEVIESRPAGRGTTVVEGNEGEGEVERARRTLVFGGWGEPVSRRSLLPQLQSALDTLRLRQHMDTEPFTTELEGAWRWQPSVNGRVSLSVSMSAVVEGVRRSSYYLDVDGAATKKLWAGFSKTKKQRAKGAHAARVRRIIKAA